MAIAAARRHPGFFNAWGQAYPRAAVTALIVLFVSAGAYTTVDSVATASPRSPSFDDYSDACPPLLVTGT